MWIVGGGSGHGFKHGPAVGRYVASLIAGDATPRAAIRARLKDDRGATIGVLSRAQGTGEGLRGPQCLRALRPEPDAWACALIPRTRTATPARSRRAACADVARPKNGDVTTPT